MKENIETIIKWRWRPYRWWVGLILFLLVCFGGAMIDVTLRVLEFFVGWMLIIFLGIAVCSDRSWYIPIRVLWFIGVLLLYGWLASMEILGVNIDFPEQFIPLYKVSPIYIGFPFIVWAMRRSRFFIEPYFIPVEFEEAKKDELYQGKFLSKGLGLISFIALVLSIFGFLTFRWRFGIVSIIISLLAVYFSYRIAGGRRNPALLKNLQKK